MTKQIQRSRKVTDTDRAWFALGVNEGKQQSAETIILLRKTNNILWDELQRLDRINPRKDVGVFLSFKKIEKLIAVLKKPEAKDYQVEALQKLLRKAKLTSLPRALLEHFEQK